MKRNNKLPLITRIEGQDASYQAEFLISKDYKVHDDRISSSSLNILRIDHLYEESHANDPNLV